MLVRHLFIHLFKTLLSKKGPGEIVPVRQGKNRNPSLFFCAGVLFKLRENTLLPRALIAVCFH